MPLSSFQDFCRESNRRTEENTTSIGYEVTSLQRSPNVVVLMIDTVMQMVASIGKSRKKCMRESGSNVQVFVFSEG